VAADRHGDQGGNREDGFELWDHWSRSSARYRETDARDVWRSMRPDGGISLATLFFEAKEHGYVQSRAGKAGRAVAAPASRALAVAPGGG
jgi:putative DNA primase/helicase